MSKIKRFNIVNYCHFVTTKTFNNVKIFNKEENVQLFLKVLYEVKEKLDFLLIGFVIMQDHLHLMIVPNTRNTISDVMRHIKGRFARFYNQSIRGINSPDYGVKDDIHGRMNSAGYEAKGSIRRMNSAGYKETSVFHRAGNSSPPERKVWQDSFYDHVLRNAKEFKERLNYIYNNPVEEKLVEKPEDYRFSSISGLYKVDLEEYFWG